MPETKYKYEVAFSFLQKDEGIANEINDLLQDRLSTFIYSKKQEELGGTDGERTFNNVFFEESRAVVVLYRDGWGETPWTRIEETAIKNRAFSKGWDFLLLVNLDNKSTLPAWIPKTYIWLDYERFGADGAIAVIEQKVKENGGYPRTETVGDRAARMKRTLIAQKERREFLNSGESVVAANAEMIKLIEKFKTVKPLIDNPDTQFFLSTKEHVNPPMYQIGAGDLYLIFCTVYPFQVEMREYEWVICGSIGVCLFTRSGHDGINYKEYMIEKKQLRFDRSLSGTHGWSDYETGENFQTSDELIDDWCKKFIDQVEKQQLNME